MRVSPMAEKTVEAPKDAPEPDVVEDTDDQMQDVSMELDSDDIVIESIQPSASEPAPLDQPPPPPSKPYIPIHIPLPPSIQEKIIIRAPSQPLQETQYNLDFESEDEPPKPKPMATEDRPHFNPKFPLPPLSILPSDFTRKAKPVRRKKDKDGKKELYKDDVVPMGLSRWAATVAANPVHTRVARATKCLSTREWGVSPSTVCNVNLVIYIFSGSHERIATDSYD
jgi:chromatin modification-related protein VID21